MFKQPIITLFSLAWLLNSCTAATQQSSPSIAKVEDCLTSSTPLQIPVSRKNNYYENFEYHIRNIVPEEKIVKFQTANYDFVFCRGNNRWAVQPGTLPSELQPAKDGSQYYRDLANPQFKTIDFDGNSYKYRVILEPNPFPTEQTPTGQTRKEPQKVVFELISPASKQPQRQTLYTLNQVKQEKIGASLGVPRITAVVKYNNRLFWSIASEQGEGASGIATIFGYDLQKQESTIIQPEAVKRQQITDLVITGEASTPTFWMGTQISGEGNPYLPGMGLVAYRPQPGNIKSGSVKFYDVNTSPLVGAIPEKLKLDNDKLWVGTGNGICQIKWQSADDFKNWSCQRFAVVTNLPKAGFPVYSSATSKNPAATLSPVNNEEMLEVLWFFPVDYQTRKGRYEVRYPQGFTVTLDDQGVNFFSKEVEQIRAKTQPGKHTFYWVGNEWHWNGARFVRGLDEVASNYVGGGARGIGSNRTEPNRPPNSNTIRGDLELLNLSQKSTSVKYYSGWIDEANIQLYLTTVPQDYPDVYRPNPLDAIAKQLQR